jgi:uncharacterized protein (DUF983 family)
MAPMREIAHPLFRSIGRGLRHRCAACGQGRLFGRYLKVEPTCARCGHELALYPADDGPAYLTILLTGHLIIAPLLFFPIIWQASPLKVLPILLGGLTVFVLATLPRIKGGWIGLMYALQVTSRDAQLHTADVSD